MTTRILEIYALIDPAANMQDANSDSGLVKTSGTELGMAVTVLPMSRTNWRIMAEAIAEAASRQANFRS